MQVISVTIVGLPVHVVRKLYRFEKGFGVSMLNFEG